MSRTYRRYAKAAGTLLDRVQGVRPDYLDKIPADLRHVHQESGTCCVLFHVFGSYEAGRGILGRYTGRLNRWEKRVSWPTQRRTVMVNALVREELRSRRRSSSVDAELRQMLEAEG